MAVTVLESNAIGFHPSANLGGGSGVIPTRAGVEAGSQSFKKGAILIESSGSIATAAADPVAAIIGVAAHDASGVTGREVLYYPALPGMVFEATLEDQSNTDHALVQGNIFANFGAQVDNNGIWYVDENETSDTCVHVVGHKDPIGTTRARVYVSFEHDKTSYE